MILHWHRYTVRFHFLTAEVLANICVHNFDHRMKTIYLRSFLYCQLGLSSLAFCLAISS